MRRHLAMLNLAKVTGIAAPSAPAFPGPLLFQKFLKKEVKLTQLRFNTNTEFERKRLLNTGILTMLLFFVLFY